jgi:YEATS family
MEHWADVSVTSQMSIVSLDDVLTPLTTNAIEARCPMCRTPTTATPNSGFEETIRSRYPSTYSKRQAEETQSAEDAFIETMALYIGNTHRLKALDDQKSPNIHEWTFFVRPSRTDIIEEVQISLHPTFRPPRVIRSLPPYEIQRLGWGYFIVTAHIILKAGYSWVSEDAERAPDGAEKGMLPLNWTLDFTGGGSQGKCRLKVRSERVIPRNEDEQEAERERMRMRRAYERDGNWIPGTLN